MAIRRKELKNMENITNLKDSLFAKLVNFNIKETGDTLCEVCAEDGESMEATHFAWGMELCFDCYCDGSD